MSALLLTMGPQLGITASIPVIAVGGPGTITFRAVGSIGQVKWSIVADTLPAEWDDTLTPTGGTATLSTAAAIDPGVYSITVRGVDDQRIPVVRTFEVRVAALPLTIYGAFSGWFAGVPATGSLTITGGVPPYAGLAVTGGALPAGVSLAIVGNQIVPSGTPTIAGEWSATVQVSDAESAVASIALSGTVGAACDPDYADVVSLLHFDGPDLSTVFTDETGKIWSGGGGSTVRIEGNELRLGGSSGDYIWSPDNPDFAMGSEDFCIELEVTLQTIGEHTVFVHKRRSNGYSPFIIGLSGAKLYCTSSITGESWAFAILDTVDFNTGVKTHVAMSRDGNTFRLFKGGQLLGSAVASGALLVTPDKLEIGRWAYENSRYVNGRVDEFRITKGVARYTSAFTPPARHPDIACP